ncbi:MAG: nitronate monooxygenase [Rhodospirillaceae bacterium]|nr:nitronate monooxygenase [Rhodospirillaceae bacterium]
MKLSTAITRLLGIDHPVLLAPMGGISGGALAGAVSAAGGLGLIGAGYADPALGWGSDEWISAEFDKAGNRAVGIGFITWALDKRPGALDAALERRPAAIMLSFGDIAPYAAKVKDTGAALICQVQTLKDALDAAVQGADIVVAQGTEAGGHGADRATLPLVPAVADAVSPVPVAAAGGIADGRGLAAALMLGAEGVLVGTRFWATQEALGHPNQKALIERTGGDDTLRTKVFDTARGLTWPEPYTGRAVRNAFSDEWHGRDDALRAEGGPLRERFFAAQRGGDTDMAVTFAGEGLDLIADRPAAGALVERMVADAVDAILAAPERHLRVADEADG